jgi:hypothetical protein
VARVVGLLWNLLVSLQVSLRRSYGSLNDGFHNSSYMLLAKFVILEESWFILFSRHPERNQEVPGQPGSWGPPWYLLVSLRVSRKRSYGRLNAGDEMDLTAYTRGLQRCTYSS